MKELKTSQDTELGEFLFKLRQQKISWRRVTSEDYLIRTFHLTNCPLQAMYGGNFAYGENHPTSPLSPETDREIMMAADKLPAHNPLTRQALLRAVGLSEGE